MSLIRGDMPLDAAISAAKLRLPQWSGDEIDDAMDRYIARLAVTTEQRQIIEAVLAIQIGG